MRRKETNMSMCGAEYTDQYGTVVCTKAKNHCGDHYAFDAETSFMWTDEIDVIRDMKNARN